MQPIRKILWPTDASEPSVRALDKAIELARHFEAEIYGLQVVSQVPTFADTGIVDAPVVGFDIALYEEELRKAAMTTLEETIKDRVPEGIRSEAHVEVGNPPDVIVEQAEKYGVDLIVMATHGRSGLSHVLLGSVAEATVRSSPVPVLVVPETTSRKTSG